ncbi:MAG: hypothetical protein LV473_18270 [Nitrospira sp.]|nr:hypothetical protein [Nitrospira sp.]
MMNFEASSDESQDLRSQPLATCDSLMDTIDMTSGSSPTKTGRRTMIRHIEYGLISIGMSVIAYLLERAVLRSIKRDAAGL